MSYEDPEGTRLFEMVRKARSANEATVEYVWQKAVMPITSSRKSAGYEF